MGMLSPLRGMGRHLPQAAQAGAIQEEVLEAVEVGIEMSGGPGTVAARFALEVMPEVFPA